MLHARHRAGEAKTSAVYVGRADVAAGSGLGDVERATVHGNLARVVQVVGHDADGAGTAAALAVAVAVVRLRTGRCCEATDCSHHERDRAEDVPFGHDSSQSSVNGKPKPLVVFPIRLHATRALQKPQVASCPVVRRARSAAGSAARSRNAAGVPAPGSRW